MFCDMYKGKTPAERKEHIETNHLCFNCLGKHKVRECTSQKTCSTCQARHHSTLHDAYPAAVTATTSHAACNPPKLLKTILLATARVRVTDRFGSFHIARPLIDQGSESSLVAESLVQRLKLRRAPSSVSIFGVGGKLTSIARGQVDLHLSSRSGDTTLEVTALVLPKLTLYDGGSQSVGRSWEHLRDLDLADPEFHARDAIELLLGADVYAKILLPGLRRGGSLEPMAQHTSLGWIISGAVGETAFPRQTHTYQCRVDELPRLVQQFWLQEELNMTSVPVSFKDMECEEHFAKSHYRTEDGRYVVKLPTVEPLPDLTGTRRSAERLLRAMERKSATDDNWRKMYSDFMQNYELLGHMSPATESSSKGGCFLPHHGVLREASSTTKLRVVFNGSSPVSPGTSLNQHLMSGPNLLPALSDVLLRWRAHRYVLATDVEKMYRQILVDPNDRHLQQVLWRYDPKDEVQTFLLNTVTYGLACAPFLAIRIIRQLAKDEEARFLEGASVLLTDVYVDDVLTGASTLEEALELQRQFIAICLAGGFPLRKWSANDTRLLAELPPEHRLQQDLLSWQSQGSHRTLGLQWHPHGDWFSYATRTLTLEPITKRTVLSLTARLFDPLGWLAPAVVRAKILFQATWLLAVDWDTQLDITTARSWTEFHAELPQLENIRVPRDLALPDANASLKMHGFADASERAYAAVLYFRSTAGRGGKTVRLVTAKTKVAPLKQVTLPRLELCAATLLVRLVAHVRRTLNLMEVPVHLWSYSTVALSWIRGHPTRWKTYVANRVSEIQTTLPETQWHHIAGSENPADSASRGISPCELLSHTLWWQGPPWLLTGEPPTSACDDLDDADGIREERSRVHAAVARGQAIEEPDELELFSSLHRLLRVTAWARLGG